jgi:hypothetical protein
MKDLTKDPLGKYVLRGKLERNESMTIEEVERLNAHNINGIRIVINTVFIVSVVIPVIIGFLYLYSNQ